MFNIIKNIALKTDHFFYKKFGSDKSLKFLENIKEARKIFSYLNETGHESRVKFVGGCVRKALSGENIEDIDLATSLEPEEVKKRLNNKNIKIIETGISHGTIVAILNGKKFDITTLRKDVATDGRHASVEFTSDWKKDASRRDFTVNSIYADIEGRIFDPYNGVSDLKSGKLKFIGSPKERIQEDYLRILRYFRFFIQYSKSDHEIETIQAIKQNINGLNKISNERIFDELQKIFKLKNASNLFLKDSSKDIILNIFPQFRHHERLKTNNKLSNALQNKYDVYLILGLLIIDGSNNYEYFCHKYKTSKKIKNRFNNISINFNNFKRKNFFSEENIKKMIYLKGKEEVMDLLLFSICIYKKIDILNINKLIDYIKNCKIPKFPISGEYLKNQGFKTGEALGKKLKLLEKKWIEDNFIIKKEIIQKPLGKDKN